MKFHPRSPAAALVLLGCLLASCTTSPPTQTTTSSSTSPSATSTPSSTAIPTPTWSADQQAAVEVATRYEAAMATVRSDPPTFGQYKMIEMLKPLAFDDMIQASLNGIAPWRDKGWHETGDQKVLTATADPPITATTGVIEVAVQICKDQHGQTVLDKAGKKVKTSYPDFVSTQYTLRKTEKSKTFKVWGISGKGVSSC